jgi:hypothetical protein
MDKNIADLIPQEPENLGIEDKRAFGFLRNKTFELLFKKDMKGYEAIMEKINQISPDDSGGFVALLESLSKQTVEPKQQPKKKRKVDTGERRRSGRTTTKPQRLGRNIDDDVLVESEEEEEEDDGSSEEEYDSSSDEGGDEEDEKPKQKRKRTMPNTKPAAKRTTRKQLLKKIAAMDPGDLDNYTNINFELNDDGTMNITKSRKKRDETKINRPTKEIAKKDPGRIELKLNQIHPKLVQFLQPYIIFSKTVESGYKGVTKFTSHGKVKGWGAQRHHPDFPKLAPIRMGTYDDKDVAALALALTYADPSLIVRLEPARWLKSHGTGPESFIQEWIDKVTSGETSAAPMPNIPMPPQKVADIEDMSPLRPIPNPPELPLPLPRMPSPEVADAKEPSGNPKILGEDDELMTMLELETQQALPTLPDAEDLPMAPPPKQDVADFSFANFLASPQPVQPEKSLDGSPIQEEEDDLFDISAIEQHNKTKNFVGGFTFMPGADLTPLPGFGTYNFDAL